MANEQAPAIDTGRTPAIDLTTVTAGDVDFGVLSCGDDGPLALCLHGFPDTAHTWRHLLPRLAQAGFRAAAPFLRGYAPTAVPADGRYQTGALSRDACLLHEALGGDGDAVIIGHDWGAMATYGAAVAEPDRWRRVVTAAVPPGPSVAAGMMSYDQLRRSFYIFFFQHPLAEVVVGIDDLEFVRRLWLDWSPGHEPGEDLDHVRAALGDPANLAAALGYYRAAYDPSGNDPELARYQDATQGCPPQPTLYLHGVDDGCMGIEIGRGSDAFLSPESTMVEVEGTGHFLHLEDPDRVGDLIVDWVTA